MKAIRIMGTMLSMAACLTFASCATETDDSEGSTGAGSATETTPNDSSGAESSKAMGVGEDNQNERLGYPANQSNLNADSTRDNHTDTVKTGSKR